jgi:hypothetical protein
VGNGSPADVGRVQGQSCPTHALSMNSGRVLVHPSRGALTDLVSISRMFKFGIQDYYI